MRQALSTGQMWESNHKKETRVQMAYACAIGIVLLLRVGRELVLVHGHRVIANRVEVDALAALLLELALGGLQ